MEPKPVTLTLVDGVRIVVPDSLDLITPYVLREQEDWFEDELAFLRVALEPGQNAIDIGANYGVYALTIARAVGPAGRVWAFEPASATARLLRQSIAANACANVTVEQSALSRTRGTARLSLHVHSELNALARDSDADGSGESVRVETLDDFVASNADIDFVKIDAEGEEAAIIEGGTRFLAQHSPLVQYEIKAGADLHTELVEAFAARGYRSYRLVPGLRVLAPFDAGARPDPFLLNLFCCKTQRAARLAAQARLVERTERAAHGATHDWRNTVARMPYAAALEPDWVRTVGEGRSGDVVEALALHALSCDASYPCAQRLRALEGSFRLFSDLCDDEPSYLRLASLARVAREYGARARAVEALARLYRSIIEHGRADLTEPFLAPSDRFDAIDPGGSIANWVLAAVLESIEELGSFSSFYTGAAARERLQTIAELGFASTEMARRLRLVNARLPV